MANISSYNLSRKWFDWCFENPEKINPNHSALYFFCIEHCNRLGWKERFGLPTTMAKEAIGIRSYNTYINTLNDLISFGFIVLIEKSKNQYSSNIIALSNIDQALDKALDKALIKHTTKQSESTGESISSIDKQLTNNNKPINQLVEEENLPNLNLPTSPFISQSETITVDMFVTYSGKDESWLNSIHEQTRHPDPKKFLPIFATWRKNSKKETATLNEFAKHFSLWIGGAIEREKTEAKQGTPARVGHRNKIL